MRLDAYTHFIPKKFLERMEQVAGDQKDIGKRMRGVPSIYDLDVRNKVVDGFADYAQILSYPMPPLEHFAKPPHLEELLKLINDGFAEICAKDPTRYPGWVAQTSLALPDAGVGEMKRALKNGALGVQIYTNVNGKPIDRPEYEAFFAAMNKNGKPVWLHPSRTATHPDYMDEKKSLYEIWWTLGWSYETAAAVSRLVFSKTMDKYPNLKLILHHFGGIIPMLEGRIGPGWDQLGARTSDEDYVSLRKSLKKRPLDYFQKDCYVDTATFGGRGAMLCGLEFYPHDKALFASDCPFDPEKGPGYIRETIKIIDSLDISKDLRDAIYYKNFEALTGRKFVK
jgi:predicted TIM-barrel fold metal-dependent hydrolase